MTYLKSTWVLAFFSVLTILGITPSYSQKITATIVKHPSNSSTNTNYISNNGALTPSYFVKLPVGSITAGGWLKHFLELQRDGLTGNLGKISIWLSKEDNAWLNKEGKGKNGWEELPYWLKGYANIGYMLKDQAMINESEFWINAVLNNQRDNGDFGPMILKNNKRDLWGNMPMLWCLESYFEYTKDKRVLPFMTKYFKWQLTLKDDQFLEDYWENSRGGDNIRSVYWLYNRTGDAFLMDLATKIDKNTADWRQKNNLPNWHNVNIAQSFREPAQYFQQSKLESDLEATYDNFKLIRNMYGQVPGGMFGSDENSRKGYDDPRQAVETCGMVEEITSNGMLLPITGDSFWADNTEDVAFNMFPSAFTPDYKALRYLTAPNMAINDSKNHSPGIDNSGPFLMMNPFSSRCCQHNHTAGWVYFEESSWMATPDNGLAVQLYNENQINAKVANGKKVSIKQETQYPFDDQVKLVITTDKKVKFPLYLRIPDWCENPQVKINGNLIPLSSKDGAYIQLEKKWNNNDVVTLTLPMKIKVRKWEKNKNSVSVNYGPLTYSLKIKENYVKRDSRTTAMGDSGWQATADAEKWPSFEIYPDTPWNYGLLLKDKVEDSFEVTKKTWPANDNPFTNQTAPIEIKAMGKRIPEWGIDQYGLVAVLPQSPVKTNTSAEELILVPMGGARLRISAFPVIK